jgi:ABC-2 type transport system ATP-binding protein
MNVIEIKNLTKSYGKARGIIDINLDIEEGEIFGFIGPNGAGKSTTIRTLLGFIYPTSGSATIFGKSCTINPEIIKEVGYLPSEFFYYDNMKV